MVFCGNYLPWNSACAPSDTMVFVSVSVATWKKELSWQTIFAAQSDKRTT